MTGKPTSRKKKATLFGAIVGVAAAGVAAGIAAERVLVGRTRKAIAEDPLAAEPFDKLPYDERRMVVTEDDVDVYAEICRGGDGTAPTLVFVHGFCLDMGTFHFQRRALQGTYDMVFYDQPGHGKSGRQAAGDYDLASLAATLRRVIDETVPDGPLVLVGHSMGAMAIMSFAEQWPALIKNRVAGVALLNTSAGKLDEVTFGLPRAVSGIRKPIVPVLATAGRLTPGVIDKARRASSDLFWLLTRRYGFGTAKPSPALVSYVERMISRTSVEIMAGYVKTLMTHSRSAALARLVKKEVLVVAGDKDLFTPPEHAEEICRMLPSAEVLIVPDAGHLALLEHPEPVNQALISLVRRAAG
ncbi:alpha/beta fold hydrolase [Longispora albida]|uniref:alpha/beta fold hydrolase n=1 Tax=Longispora albida TaxID=203523 RepID=UPI00036F0E45|nr:alpha/beta hydrolase [Longispora albida]